MKFSAKFYDGNTSKCYDVDCIYQSGVIQFRTYKEFFYKIEEIRSQAPFDNCPLVLELPDGARLEIADYGDLKDVFLNKKSTLLYFLENNQKIIILSALSLILTLFAFVKIIIPAGAEFIAIEVPQKWSNSLDKQILESVYDNTYESKLSDELKKEIRLFLIKNTHESRKRAGIDIHFRRGGSLVGPNAFALAGKTIIFTDEFIKKVPNKYHVLAVYLHEVGHLDKRHVLSNLISAAGVGFLSFLVIGDLEGFTESLASIGYSLITLSYSRKFEYEADEFAKAYLKSFDISPRCFAQVLMKVTESSDLKKKEQESMSLEYFSTHPDTDKRISEIFETYKRPCKVEYWSNQPVEDIKTSQKNFDPTKDEENSRKR